MPEPLPTREKKPPETTLIIPVFNEESRILSTLETLEALNHSHSFNFHCLIVNDGSSDKSATLISNFTASRNWVEIINLDRNHGKGEAVKQGVLRTTTRTLFFIDADLPVPLQDTIPPALSLLDNDTDLVIGARRHPESRVHSRTLSREFISRFGNFLIRQITGLPYLDTQCGFKGFRRDCATRLFRRITSSGYLFDLELLVQAQRLGFRVKEVPVDWYHIPDGSFRPGRDSLRTLLELLYLKSRGSL